MALEISIYNRRALTSKVGKTYNGYSAVFTPGQSGRLSEADQLPPFYIRDQRGKKQWVRLEANTISEAKAEAAKAQEIIKAAAKGVPIATDNASENRLATRIDAYLEEIEANKVRGTWRMYSRSLELFRESCRRLNVEHVRREDLLAFKTYMRKKGGIGERSVYNYFLNTMVFLKWCGHNAGVKKNDWPPKTEREAEEYQDEEIEALLKEAAKTFRGKDRMKCEKNDDRLLLNALLCSGLRDGEVAHLTYKDIDVRTSLWAVRPKKGHRLKTEESHRLVPVGEWLTRKIIEKKREEKRGDDDLVFPSKHGLVDEHLIRIVKRIATKAGIQGRVDNHKFRSTAITIWLRDGRTVPEVMSYVGHVSPETILRYAAKVNLEKKENREKVTRPFDRYATMGD